MKFQIQRSSVRPDFVCKPLGQQTVSDWYKRGQEHVLTVALGLATLIGCASEPGNATNGTGGVPASSTGGATVNGGTATGGLPSAGGAGTGGSASTGGTLASGGVSTGGVSVTTGGTSGGASGTGGASSGGASSGGASSGGASSGGSGGASSSGAGNGGAPSTGGKGNVAGQATGGVSNGGRGGAAGTGGSTGGVSTSGGSGGSAGNSRGGSSGAAGAAGAAGSAGYNPCPTTGSTACAVLPLGDSITEGCCTAPMGGYRIELFRQAVQNHKNLTFVGSATNGPETVENLAFPKHHEGHGGYTISGGGSGAIAGTITDSALSNYHPHIVLLMIGTNDINGNIDVANAPNRLKALVDDILTRAPAALLVVSSIIPTTTDGTNTRVRTYNTAVRDLVSMRATEGKHIVFVDNYEAFAANASFKTALMADNLHPNSAGYTVLGKSFYGAVSGVLPAGQ